jgi:hypothetical protein
MGREVSSSSEGRAVQVRVKKREEWGGRCPVVQKAGLCR